MYLSQEGTSSSNPEAAAASARLAPSLQHDLAAWKAWFDHSSPEDQPLPKSFDDELSAMQKLLVSVCEGSQVLKIVNDKLPRGWPLNLWLGFVHIWHSFGKS